MKHLRLSAASELEPTPPLSADPEFSAQVADILGQVRSGGDAALRRLAERFDRLEAEQPLVLDSGAMAEACRRLNLQDRDVLRRMADRIRSFAEAQMDAARDVGLSVDGGEAGHRWAPVERAGCYAPGGRYPLPSSVLMTVIPARVAGVADVWLANPNPQPVTLAAAYYAGADGVLVAGGAQAVGALAYGTESVPAVDVIVGPGNSWVTSAKHQVSTVVKIDMLAGPSELLVVADDSAEPRVVAADLLAQAEHDVEARVGLLTTHEPLLAAVDESLTDILETLPTRGVALESLSRHGYAALCTSVAEAAETSDRLAPEHLHLHLEEASKHADSFRHYGGIFIGSEAAEVLGDYGVGPNHTLPTAQTGRFRGGLSVFDFMACRTWLRMDDPLDVAADAERIAEMEGLAAHALSARLRRH
ncbi:MAG: histidinol dehydrogenase [Myxococcota bacterium]